IVSGLTFGFFAPLFFGFIGIEFNVKSIVEYIPLFVALLAVAITTKIGGGFIGAKISKFSDNDSLAIGALMNGRGMMELAIAAIGLGAGILNISLFSIAIAIGFVTTILAPLLARPFIIKAKLRESTKVIERDTEKVGDSHIVNPF
ncbi:MAG: cation:proton antiporter, partial [Nitrosopumilaceae archaeon]